MLIYDLFFGGLILFTSKINVVVQVHRNLHKVISMTNDEQQGV